MHQPQQATWDEVFQLADEMSFRHNLKRVAFSEALAQLMEERKLSVTAENDPQRWN